MSLNSVTLLRRAAALLAALCVDLALFCAAGSVVTRSAFAHLARVWLCAPVRCLALRLVARRALGDVRPLLARYIAAHALLPAVLESGVRALRHEESPCEGGSDPRCWALCSAACLAAALFWEVTVPEAQQPAERRQRNRVLLVRVLRLYRPDLPLLLGGFIFLTLAVCCEMSIPYYTGRIIDVLRGQHQLDHFSSALLFMGLYSVGSAVCAGCRGGFLLWAINSFTCRIKVMLFGSLTKQEVGFFETIKTGEITNRLSDDTTKMARTVCLNINVLLRTLIRTLGIIYLMLTLSWKLTFLVLMETPVTGLIQNLYDTHERRLAVAIQDSAASANETASEVVSSVRVVRSFNGEKHEACRYGDRLTKTNAVKTRRGTVRAVYLLVRRLTGLAMQVIILYYGRLFIQRGQMTAGSLLSFILYQSDVGDNIRTVIYSVGDMLNSVVAAGKVFEYLDRKPLVGTDGNLKPDQLTGRVSFRGVTFAYPANPAKTVLQGLSLELQPGQVTALVGPSGEGKSTCVNLLQRFYEPQDGEILLDDEPLRSYDHRYLHNKVAVVNQDPVLFSGSIRDNIAYGFADCSLDEIQEAAHKANAHDFIRLLARGYDTEVGEGGSQLSKSEKQRVAIARALLRRPRVLVLDEITSSLDSESENKVQQALIRRPDQTTLVIAHKLKTVEKADQIVLIRGGRVEERGTHQELMDMRGRYHKLVENLFAEC